MSGASSSEKAYKELTGAHFHRRDHAKLAKRLVRRLEDLGLKVTVSQAA